MTPLIHLHTHSYFSLLDGCPSPEELAQAAARAGMPALALTDHDALYGAIEFYDACHRVGVQPILGMELTMEAGDETPVTLVLLARNLEGYANLCRLSSALQTQPDREAAFQRGLPADALENRTAGLIALSGGKRGQIERLLRDGRPREAALATMYWAERFGRENFYLELQLNAPGDAEIAALLTSLASRQGLGIVATNNVHYLTPDGAAQCRLVAAMRALRPLDQTAPRPGLHLTSPDQMATDFADLPEALANTRAIASRCHLELPLGQPVFPEITMPAGETPLDRLRSLSLEGAKQRYETLTGAVRDRLDHEIATIDSMGYTPLFLIVADIVRQAREEGVPINLRGSAAGSLVAYCLGISSVDPIVLGLYFERFLNPGRRDPPDIDLDLCSRRRDEVINYVYQRFGQDRVATICTYARLRARSAWREVAKAYRLPQSRIDAVAQQVPRFWHPGMLPEVQEAKEKLLARAQSTREQEALKAAWALDGFPRHLSIHPGGVVIAPGPLTDLVPLQVAAKGVIIAQYDLRSIERLGLVKIDLLGIRALTVVSESIQLMQHTQSGFSRESIPRCDAATADRLSEAATIGCFQIESPGMRRTLRELGARTVDDVAASLALYKPGPLRGGLKEAFVRRHRGQEPVRYLHSSLEPILRNTYGVVLYQEQVLRIAHELAGFSLSEADQLRRAIAHLGHGEEMKPLRASFVERAGRTSGMPEDVASRLWELMFSFAGYGFLKAHAASYAVVAYQTAYLKTHHPAEFMAAVLRNWGGYYPQRIYLGEARRMGLDLHPPHINQSGRRFELVYEPSGQPALWMGLGQVRELTRKTIAAILNARQEKAFESLDDLLRRAGPRLQEAENLIKAGALDGLGPGRKALLTELQSRKPGAPLQLALPWTPTPAEDFTPVEKLALEVKMLGWPTSAHPLEPFARELVEQATVRSDKLAEHVGRKASVAGALMDLWGRRRGRRVLEDEAGLFAIQLPGGSRPSPGRLGKLGPYLAYGRVHLSRTGEVTVLVEQIDAL
jgi:DNA-directed DNA polymerase III PolC